MVGNEELIRKFAVHETLLRKDSAFFRDALDGDRLEPTAKIITLPEQSPAAFEVYTGWLYYRKIYSDGESITAEVQFSVLLDAYYLAGFLGDIDFADAIMDAVIDTTITLSRYPCEVISPAYEKLPRGSPLRQLLLDMWVYDGNSEWWDIYHDVLTPEILNDIVSSLIAIKGTGAVDGTIAPYEFGHKCNYHLHEQTEQPCYLTKLTGR